MMPKTMVIEIADAVVVRGHTRILSGVSLHVGSGECVIITGPNGAGKTTLLSLINGMERPSAGSLRVLGACPSGKGQILRRRIGYVSQIQRLDPRMPITVRESVMTGIYGRLGWGRKPAKNDLTMLDEVLAELGLGLLATHPLGTLSGGEMRRVAIARALVQDPDIMLLDEPTASLDGDARLIVEQAILSAWKEKGKTVLWVTHDPEPLEVRGMRTIGVRAGRIVMDARYPQSDISTNGFNTEDRLVTAAVRGV